MNSRYRILFAVAMLLTAATTAKATNLTLAQYSDATAAIQNAINNSGTGVGVDNDTVINIPAGLFFISGSLNLNGSRPITIRGAGGGLTRLVWVSDLGAGQYAINSGEPVNNYHIELDDLELNGPGNAPKIGTLPAQMYGVHALDQMVIRDCYINGFKAGVVVDGNHQQFYNLTLTQNYYGAYYVAAEDNSYFDQMWEGCDFTGDTFAGVACDGVAEIGTTTFLRCHAGFEPYGFYREKGVEVSQGRQGWIYYCQFLQCEFEGCGNADFWDEDGVSAIDGNKFSECNGYGGRYSVYAIAGRSTSPSMRAGTYSANNVDSAGPNPGDMNVAYVQNNYWNIPGITLELEAGQIAPITGNVDLFYNYIVDGENQIAMRWSNGAVQQYEPVEQGNNFYLCEAATGNNPVIGVSLTPVPSSGGAVYLQQHGTVPVASSTKIALNQPVNIYPGGFIFSSAGSTKGYVIGVAAWPGVSGQIQTMLTLGL